MPRVNTNVSSALDSTQKPALYMVFQKVLASLHNVHVHFQTGHNQESQSLCPWSTVKPRYQQTAPLSSRVGGGGLPLLLSPCVIHHNYAISPLHSIFSPLCFELEVVAEKKTLSILLNHLYLIRKMGGCNSVNRTCSITSWNRFSSESFTIWSKQLNKHSYVIS